MIAFALPRAGRSLRYFKILIKFFMHALISSHKKITPPKNFLVVFVFSPLTMLRII